MRPILHDLVLHPTHLFLSFHRIAALGEVLDVGQAERTTAVLITLELRDGGGSIILVGEFDDTCSARATIGFVLNFGARDLVDSAEQLVKILVAGAPW